MMRIATKEESLLSLLNRLWIKLSRRRQRQLTLLSILMLISSLAEVISLASVVPFLSILVNPESLWNNDLLKGIFSFMRLKDQNQLLLPITTLFVIASISSAFIRLLNIWINGRVAAAIGSDLSIEAYRRTLNQPYSTHLKSNSSQLISSISLDINIIISNVIRPILELMSSLLITFGVVITLLLFNFKAAFSIGFIIFFIYVLAIKYNSIPLKLVSLNIVRLNNQLIKLIQEGLGGIREIILDKTQNVYTKIYSKTDRNLRKLEARRGFLSYYPRLLLEPLGTSMIAILGYILVKSGGLETALTTLGVLALGSMRLLPMVQKAYEGWALPKGSKESLINILNLLNQPIIKEKFPEIKSNIFNHNVVCKDVAFNYHKNSKNIYKNLNLEIKKGDRIGITGETGSGKSTTIDLIMGLIIPTHGSILVDGKDIHSKQHPNILTAWQSSIVHVPQNIFLADTSIAENIVFGVPYDEIDFNRLNIACKKAKIYDFISSCSKGYKTFVGERGIRLSGGQRQRIAIARALYKKRNFLILDEATSALDNKTEEHVMRNLDSSEKKLTIIMIAHRLNSLKYCNRILHLSNGELVEKELKNI